MPIILRGKTLKDLPQAPPLTRGSPPAKLLRTTQLALTVSDHGVVARNSGNEGFILWTAPPFLGGSGRHAKVGARRIPAEVDLNTRGRWRVTPWPFTKGEIEPAPAMTALEKSVQFHCARRPAAPAAMRVYDPLHCRHSFWLVLIHIFSGRIDRLTQRFANLEMRRSPLWNVHGSATARVAT